MKFAIIGCGKFGQEILQFLVENGNHDIYCIEENPKVVEELNNTQDVMAVEGTGTDIELLKEIGMEKIDFCVACTGSDEINALTCIYAKKLGAKHTISRILNQDHNTPGARFLKDEFKIELLVNPMYQTAKAIHNIIKREVRKGDIMLLGATQINVYLSRMLHKDGIYEVKIIDNNQKLLEKLAAVLPEDILLCNGDCADHNILISEGLTEVKGFVSATELDEENILTSLFAVEHEIPCIVTEINKTSYTDIVRDLNLEHVISPIGATTDIIIKYIDNVIQEMLEEKKKKK